MFAYAYSKNNKKKEFGENFNESYFSAIISAIFKKSCHPKFSPNIYPKDLLQITSKTSEKSPQRAHTRYI